MEQVLKNLILYRKNKVLKPKISNTKMSQKFSKEQSSHFLR